METKYSIPITETETIRAQIAQGIDAQSIVFVLLSFLPDAIRAMNAFFLARAGQYLSITYKRECKKLKGYEDIYIEKEAVSVFRVGIEYNNIGRVQNAHESGKVNKEGLDEGNFKLSPILYYSIHTGKFRFAIAPTFNTSVIKHTRYFRNGEVVDKESLYSILAASEMSVEDMNKAGRKCNRKEEKEPLLLTFNPENIVEYH